MPTLKHKVLAYITQADRLLVFRHPFVPEAGIQVPAGTIKVGELPAEAVMREASEETGLTNLTLVRWLGDQVRDMSDFGLDQIHHRYFYHLRCDSDPPITWRHTEPDPSDATPEPIVFEFYWAQLPHEVPQLIADHGLLLPQLLEAIAIRSETS